MLQISKANHHNFFFQVVREIETILSPPRIVSKPVGKENPTKPKMIPMWKQVFAFRTLTSVRAELLLNDGPLTPKQKLAKCSLGEDAKGTKIISLPKKSAKTRVKNLQLLSSHNVFKQLRAARFLNINLKAYLASLVFELAAVNDSFEIDSALNVDQPFSGEIRFQFDRH